MKILANKNIGILLIPFLGILAANSTAAVGSNWIEQSGIRWTFDKNLSTDGSINTYRYGTFVNGDYWIIGPVTLTGITPKSIEYQFRFVPNSSGIKGTFSSSERVTQPATGAAGTVITVTNQGDIYIEPDANSNNFAVNNTISTAAGDSFTPSLIETRILHGSMINPNPSKVTLFEGHQAFDSEMHAWHTTTNRPYPQWRRYETNGVINVARKNGMPISSSNTLTIAANNSLVSSVSKSAPARTILQAQAILTVLSAPPSPGSFRPPYSGTDKNVYFNASLLNEPDKGFDRLLNLAPANSTQISTIEAYFQKPWIDFISGQFGQSGRSHNMPEYSREIGTQTGDAALILNIRQHADSNTNNEIKKTLLIRFVQLGIDNYGVIKAGSNMQYGNWPPLEGQNMGHKLPILFAGYMLGGIKHQYNTEADKMLNIPVYNSALPVGTFNPVFQEDLQHWYVTQSDVGRPVRGVNKGYGIAEEYTEAHVGLPEWGTRHLGPYAFPSDDDAAWLANYRAICAVGMLGHALVIHIMQLRDVWNNEVFFDYHDRYYQVSKGEPVAYQAPTPLTKAMWDKYRADYGPVWPNKEPAPDTYSLTVVASNGSVTKSPSKTSYTAGETVSLTAAPASGYTFSNWSGDASGTANPVTITMNSNKSVTANFSQIPATTYTLTISAVNGSVTKSPNKTSYTAGETVSLTAAPASGYTFSNWSGDASGTVNPVTITMNSNKTVTANFSQIPATTYTLTISAVNGSVTKLPNKTSYNTGETVSLTAAPNSGYTFSNWSGDASGTANPVTITMNSNKTVTANFSQIPVALSITALLNLAFYSKLDKQYFDGIDDYQSISTANWNPAGMTLSMWANPDTITGTHYLFGHTVGAWSNRIQLYIQDGQIGLGLGDTHTRHTNIHACQSGQWYFITLTWQGSNYSVYVNNILKASGIYSGLTQFNTFADIGNTGNPDYRTQEPFSGTIDDVRIFAEALTSSQVASLFDYGRNGSLTSHWRLDDYASGTTADSSENTYTATLIKEPTWGHPWADEDYILLTSKMQAMEIPSAAIRPQAGTIAVWVSPASASSAQYLFGHVFNSSNRIALLTVSGNLAVSMGSKSLIQQNIAYLPVNQLTHVALTWNNGQYTVHVDGEQKAVGTYSGLTELNTIFDIGNYGDPAARIVGFLGLIDEVRTYSRALAPDEIAALYQTYNVKENRELAFGVQGVDEQGNPVFYSTSALPIGANFETGTQNFFWRPWYNQAGQYNVIFNADGQPSQNVTINVEKVILQEWYREFLKANGKL